MCGINVPADSQDGGRLLPQIEVAATYVGSAVAMLKQRFRAQVNLTRQLVALGVGVGVRVWSLCMRGWGQCDASVCGVVVCITCEV